MITQAFSNQVHDHDFCERQLSCSPVAKSLRKIIPSCRVWHHGTFQHFCREQLNLTAFWSDQLRLQFLCREQLNSTALLLYRASKSVHLIVVCSPFQHRCSLWRGQLPLTSLQTFAKPCKSCSRQLILVVFAESRFILHVLQAALRSSIPCREQLILAPLSEQQLYLTLHLVCCSF